MYGGMKMMLNDSHIKMTLGQRSIIFTYVFKIRSDSKEEVQGGKHLLPVCCRAMYSTANNLGQLL